eukprot:9291446-Lingulodinium_polyedra.AAC.1
MGADRLRHRTLPSGRRCLRRAPERCRPPAASTPERAAKGASADRRRLTVPGAHGGWQLAWHAWTWGPEL